MLHIVIKDNFRKFVKSTDVIKKYLGEDFLNGSNFYLGFEYDDLYDHEEFISEISGLEIALFYLLIEMDNKITSEYYEIILER